MARCTPLIGGSNTLRLSVGLMLCRPNPADFLEAKSTLAQSKMTWV